MSNQRPGVYIEEIALLPPSVAGVSTAVPAFFGYTEKGDLFTPTRITSMLEFTETFGGPPQLRYKYDLTASPPTLDKDLSGRKFLLYYALRSFFQYGDAPCYIISLGCFSHDSVSGSWKPDLIFEHFEKGLKALEKEDEPTLIVFPEAVSLGPKFYSVCNTALQQCELLKDRFVIMDVPQDGDVTACMDNFRNGIGSNNLKYGAAYFPYLSTIFSYQYDDELVEVENGIKQYLSGGDHGLRITYSGAISKPEVMFLKEQMQITEMTGSQLSIKGIGDGVNATVLKEALPEGFTGMLFNGGTDEVSSVSKMKAFISSVVNGLAVLSGNPSDSIAYASNQGDATEFGIEPGEPNLLTIKLPEGGATASKITQDWDTRDNPQATGFTLGYLGDGSADILPTASIPEATEVFKTNGNGLLISYQGGEAIVIDRFDFREKTNNKEAIIKIIGLGAGVPARQVVSAWTKCELATSSRFHLNSIHDGTGTVLADSELIETATLAAYKVEGSKLYQEIAALLAQELVELPPSAAVAGIYAKVDRERGVWKAPANVSLNGVLGPGIKLTDEEHDRLNVHAEGGKSINAIRNYTGKGTLVMGARTLAGNDNEWRYINVRRLFNMVEESTKKATEVFIFEPNNITTWLKVKGMIESYLFGLWQRGALVGATPEQAYFVSVGLGKTMTAQDILEGFMKVDIGLAAVRPAEFIILRFMHKLQEA